MNNEGESFDERFIFISFQIEDGEIYASINQKDGMVSFHSNPEKYNDPRMLKRLDVQVSKDEVSGKKWTSTRVASASFLYNSHGVQLAPFFLFYILILCNSYYIIYVNLCILAPNFLFIKFF